MFFLYSYRVLGVYIIPKWRIHDFRSIAILFGTWLDRQKCYQIWTLGPRIYHQNISRNTRKYGNIFETYYFHIWDYDVLKNVGGPRT